MLYNCDQQINNSLDIALIIIGFLLTLVGIIGSFIPVLPGPPVSWVGLLLLHLTNAVPMNKTFLIVTAIIALLVTVLDYIIPAAGTKKFGGSKAGMWGSIIGLLVAIFFPILGPFGIIIWPFVGALVGELSQNKDQKRAWKAAFGSFIGFLTGTFLKFLIAIIYCGLFIWKTVEIAGEIFQFS
ncbi:membrane protein [Croceivirga lutea]|nr:membrane protein [Croceivirga lutea]